MFTLWELGLGSSLPLYVPNGHCHAKGPHRGHIIVSRNLIDLLGYIDLDLCIKAIEWVFILWLLGMDWESGRLNSFFH